MKTLGRCFISIMVTGVIAVVAELAAETIIEVSKIKKT